MAYENEYIRLLTIGIYRIELRCGFADIVMRLPRPSRNFVYEKTSDADYCAMPKKSRSFLTEDFSFLNLPNGEHMPFVGFVGQSI